MIKKFFLYKACDIVVASSDDATLSDRVASWFKSLLTFTPILLIMNGFNVWFEDNVMFFSFTILTIFINMILGGFMHWYRKTFSLEELLIKTIKMIIIILISYMMLEFIAQLIGDKSYIGELFEKTIQVSTLLFPIGKILKNIFILSDGKHPPEFIMKKIYNFQKTGDLKDFIDLKCKKNDKKD